MTLRYSSPLPLKLFRYLIACKINGAFVHIPSYFPAEISVVLGTAIKEHLPSAQSHAWKTAMAPWEKQGSLSVLRRQNFKHLPEVRWPIDTIIFPYPMEKKFFGLGETIFIELKFMGKNFDHSFFLEVILPVLEQLGQNFDDRWHQPYSIWGRFDIDAIYVARGLCWEPVVQYGKLNLKYRPTTYQWAKELFQEIPVTWLPDSLLWLTPVNILMDNNNPNDSRKKKSPISKPTITNILEALIFRMSYLLSGKRIDINGFWKIINSKDKKNLKEAFEQAKNISIYNSDLNRAKTMGPKHLTGWQTFSTTMPKELLPYLTLAAVLHIGSHTHLGCGTFLIKNHRDI